MVSQTRHQANITNLEPGCEYEFMVLSQDRFGDGMFSKTYRYFTTGEYKKLWVINVEPLTLVRIRTHTQLYWWKYTIISAGVDFRAPIVWCQYVLNKKMILFIWRWWLLNWLQKRQSDTFLCNKFEFIHFLIFVLSSASFHWCTQRCNRACAAFRANWSTKECVRRTSGYGLWICCLVGSTRLRTGYITVGFVRLFSCDPQMILNLPSIFRVYVVRWYVEPGHHLMGTGETRETYYRGL